MHKEKSQQKKEKPTSSSIHAKKGDQKSLEDLARIVLSGFKKV